MELVLDHAQVERLIESAAGHYDAALKAQRAGDWAAYGREIKALGEVLEDLRLAAQGE